MKLLEETEDYIVYSREYPHGFVKGILCKKCNRISYNSNDVQQKYCPCKGYHQRKEVMKTLMIIFLLSGYGKSVSSSIVPELACQEAKLRITSVGSKMTDGGNVEIFCIPIKE